MIALVEGAPPEQETLLLANIQRYKPVLRTSVQPMAGRDDPMTAANVDITTPGDYDRINIELEGAVSQSSRPTVFSFDARVGSLRPDRIVDLDEELASSSRQSRGDASTGSNDRDAADRERTRQQRDRQRDPW
jgi:hypothetical protein